MFTCDKITNGADGMKDMIEIELEYSKQRQRMSVVLRCRVSGAKPRRRSLKFKAKSSGPSSLPIVSRETSRPTTFERQSQDFYSMVLVVRSKASGPTAFECQSEEFLVTVRCRL